MRIFFLLVAALSILNGTVNGQNPFVTHMYTADLSARVFNDTLYIYPSHDQDTATWFSMVDWHVLSTVDMKHWVDHRVAFSVDDISCSGRGQILYAMAGNPYGPLEYRGVNAIETNHL